MSLRASAAYDLSSIWEAWSAGGIEAAQAEMTPLTVVPTSGQAPVRRVLRHPSGFRQSPFADVAPPGSSVRQGHGLASSQGVGRKLWHSSPGSAGR
ncbi:hypothetical protein GCM10025883_18450 [Mobilicoccus caccae]|uniref:Uncharacterized protein n=1 Tax=Mobilicoccus caccae TaxID=1859295 RepID=A0ABQ6IPF6_9MICO|nr:hypothetical protein GCM10025883_18450 [Mobilicoccus caccae]